MSSWYSTLITKTSSQISSFRANIGSSDNDGDTEDDTHVCRVLRNYYADKGRPYPGWLPPDPKAPVQAAPIQPLLAHGSSSQHGAGGRQHHPGGSPSIGGPGGGQPGLSSLWDNGGAQQQAAAAPQSLRVGRGPAGGAQGGSGSGAGGGGMAGLQRGGNGMQKRPVGGDRAGSYSGQGPPAPSSAGGGASAQDRLRQRLWGNGGAKSTSPSSTSQPFPPPSQGHNPYRR